MTIDQTDLQAPTFLEETPFLDHSHPKVQEYVAEFRQLSDPKEQAKQLYLKVRDGFLYDPYHLDLRPQSLAASAIIGKPRAWCVEKAIVCCSGLRALDIPARLGFGIVKNHVGVDKLVSYLRKDEIVFHGFVEVLLNNNWTKCTPAFDRRICRINRVEPLEWDGTADSLFQAFRGDEQYMEYLHFYGSFADVPVGLMHREMQAHYPHLFETPIDTTAFSFRFDSTLVIE
ncbi:MAG TPA: transglutaminase-like domain-containing protein [Fluviicola sp.]|nr:transglutaminase-like domain-containing protein [Fluviicola sp.]